MNTDKIIAESIAKEYASKKHSKIVALKKLDEKAKRPVYVFAYTFGTLSTLIAGTGLCLSMKVIGETMPHMVLGIVIGVIGFICCGINYSLYKKILEHRKKKYAYEIIELAKEIGKEE